MLITLQRPDGRDFVTIERLEDTRDSYVTLSGRPPSIMLYAVCETTAPNILAVDTWNLGLRWPPYWTERFWLDKSVLRTKGAQA